MSGKSRRIFETKGRRFIEETTTIRVRFQEVDSMAIVWHGHYISYFEEARRAFGRRYDMDYPVFWENNVAAPITSLWIDFLSPARMTSILDVRARLYESEGAKIEFLYNIAQHGKNEILVVGGSVQVFTTLKGELLLTKPGFLKERYARWEPFWQLEK